MGIKPETGPENGEALVGNAFSAMTEGPANLFESEAVGAAPAARILRPIPIFAIDLDRLYDEGAGALRHAWRKGWRYLVEHDDGMDVVDLPESGNRQPEMIAGGEVADNLVRSARKAERIAEAGPDYELRLLDLNLIGDSVLWLHDPSGAREERFVSLARTPRELKPEALVQRLRAEATRKLSAIASAGTEGGG